MEPGPDYLALTERFLTECASFAEGPQASQMDLDAMGMLFVAAAGTLERIPVDQRWSDYQEDMAAAKAHRARLVHSSHSITAAEARIIHRGCTAPMLRHLAGATGEPRSSRPPSRKKRSVASQSDLGEAVRSELSAAAKYSKSDVTLHRGNYLAACLRLIRGYTKLSETEAEFGAARFAALGRDREWPNIFGFRDRLAHKFETVKLPIVKHELENVVPEHIALLTREAHLWVDPPRETRAAKTERASRSANGREADKPDAARTAETHASDIAEQPPQHTPTPTAENPNRRLHAIAFPSAPRAAQNGSAPSLGVGVSSRQRQRDRQVAPPSRSPEKGRETLGAPRER